MTPEQRKEARARRQEYEMCGDGFVEHSISPDLSNFLAEALDALEAVEPELAGMRGEVRECKKIIGEKDAEIAELRALNSQTVKQRMRFCEKIAKLREALEYYAQSQQHNWDGSPRMYDRNIARKALKGMKEKK